MGVGTCRHCGANWVAADAVVCGRCGGWHPNPGFVSRTVALFRVLLGLAMLGAAAFCLYMESQGNAGWWVYSAVLGAGGLAALFRPYGKPPGT